MLPLTQFLKLMKLTGSLQPKAVSTRPDPSHFHTPLFREIVSNPHVRPKVLHRTPYQQTGFIESHHGPEKNQVDQRSKGKRN
jgi:hypothetical protein